MRESVILVMFDLPTDKPEVRRKSARFRKRLLRLGYLMLQESIYYKMIKNVSSLDSEQKQVEQILPDVGNVQFLPLPLRQFMEMTPLLGNGFDFERLTASVIEIG